jgi:ABC-type transport system involved in cytochrome c biogenesis permease subunit
MTLRSLWIASCLAFAALPPSAAAQTSGARTEPWPAHIVELAAQLPIQDGGRIKPLSTYADFTLLALNGKRTTTTSSGERLSATEWLLDALFYPDFAAEQAVFLVQDDAVIEAIGLDIPGRRKRDRYSFAEIQPGLPKLMSLAHDYSAIEAKNQTSLQSQIVFLAESVMSFVRVTRHETLALVPPVSGTDEWQTPSELLARASAHEALPEAHAALLASFESLWKQGGSPASFESELAAVHARVVEMATARGEYGKIDLEIQYYKAQLLTWSLVCFVVSFVVAAFMWLRPKSRALYTVTSAGVLVASLLLVATIVFRCVIRGRPPVSTLYETVLFVTAVGTLIALALEWINRARIAVSAAALLGMVGVFIANGYETLDKKDTMPSLVAVLDTNFWLATHVTAITVGYSAGLLAALLGSIYLLSRAARVRQSDRAYYSALSRMVYGVLCFGLIFATVGTILGGIWANDSWGRFWGWDPKENGALLIVLTQIVILHARMGGYLRDHGLCMAAAFGGTVVAFSWWGVNLLGVGLHSYGFTSGIHTVLWTYYGLQWGIVGVGAVSWLLERSAARTAVPVRVEEPVSTL